MGRGKSSLARDTMGGLSLGVRLVKRVESDLGDLGTLRRKQGLSSLITRGNSLGDRGVGIEMRVLGLVRWCLEWLRLSVL